MTNPMTNTGEQPGNSSSTYSLIIKDLCANVANAAGKELQRQGKTINDEVVKKICTEIIETWLAPALSNWVESSIPEPDESGCSESIISHEDMADFLRQKTHEMGTTYMARLVNDAVTVLESIGPDEAAEILAHTPNPGFFETMTGRL